MVNWIKLLYVLVIALLYVPMVFLGSNVFFPKFTGSESYFRGTEECYPRFAPSDKLPLEEQQRISDEQQKQISACQERMREQERIFNEERSVYNGWKYAFITGFNLVILIAALLLPLMDAVLMGLFIGTVVTAFSATVSYWEYARTKTGFVLMLAMFFIVLFFVNRRQKALLDWKSTKKK